MRATVECSSLLVLLCTLGGNGGVCGRPVHLEHAFVVSGLNGCGGADNRHSRRAAKIECVRSRQMVEIVAG